MRKTIFLGALLFSLSIEAATTTQAPDGMVEASVDQHGRISVSGQPTGLKMDQTAPKQQPRKHHFTFGKMILPMIALSQPADFLDTFTTAQAQTTLHHVWRNVGADLPPTERLPVDGLTVHHQVVGGLTYIVMTFPTPIASNELFYAVIVADRQHPETLRVFGLEKTQKNDFFTQGTVLVEWNKIGRTTYEAHIAPEEASCRTAVAQVLQHNIKTRTFTDMRPYGWFAD